MRAAEHVKRRLLEDVLQRGGQILVAARDGLVGLAGRAKQIDEPLGVDVRDRRLAVVPRHRDLARPVPEVLEVEVEPAARPRDGAAARDLVGEARLAVGRRAPSP